MVVEALFFDAVAGDRVYNASDFDTIFSSMVREGYIAGFAEEFRPHESTPTAMTVVVEPGRAFIQGKLFEITAAETITVPANGDPNARIDRLVARINYSARVGELALKQGTPATTPSPPVLQRDASAYEVSIAQVHVASGAVEIVAANITDERKNSALFGAAITPAFGGDVPGVIKMHGGATAPAGWFLCDGAAVSRTDYADLFDVIGTTFGVGDGTTTFNLPNFAGRVPIGVGTLGTDTYARGGVGGSARHTLTSAEMPAHTHGASSGVNSVAHTHNAVGAGVPLAGDHTHTQGASGATGHSHDVGYYIDWAYSDPNGLQVTEVRSTAVSGSVPVIGDGTHGHTNPNTDAGGSHDHGSHTHTSDGPSSNHTHAISVTNTGGGGAHENRQPHLAVNYIVKW